MRLKYIIDCDNNFVIFSPSITHSSLKSQDLGEIVGAGFCTIRVEECEVRSKGGDCRLCADDEFVGVHCFGESISLKIKSRDEDGEIISRKINSYD